MIKEQDPDITPNCLGSLEVRVGLRKIATVERHFSDSVEVIKVIPLLQPV